MTPVTVYRGATPSQLKSFECHEGNFGLRNVLSAARANETKQRKE